MTKRLASVAVVVAIAALAPDAGAQRTRRRFEPTDLNLTAKGVAEIDVQGGYVVSEPENHVIAPDVEASLGIAQNAEIEIDTSYGLERGKPMFLDQTWASLRLGVYDVPGKEDGEAAWAAGVQAGPKLPTGPDSRGLGFESIAIGGRNVGRVHLFLQAGMLLDPEDLTLPNRTRPFGVEGGGDLDLDLDDVDRWSIHAELGGVRFFSPHPDQIHATAGAALRVVPSLEVSAVALVGLLPGSDRFGILLGVAPRFRLF
jgi:hypothetical protein